MVGEQLKMIARREFEEVYSRGNLDVVDEIVSAEYVCYDPALPEPVRGREGLKQAVTGFRRAFPDLTFTVEDQIVEGDTVVTRWTATGTHRGELFGLAGTGRRVTMTGIDIERFADGRIVEVWASWDLHGLLRQLGFATAPVVA
jgi:steroid delta-isomerase-like uncharacterized protein